MLNSNVNYVQYKINSNSSSSIKKPLLLFDSIDCNNNISKKFQQNDNNYKQQQQICYKKCLRKKTINFFLKYLIILTLTVLLIEIIFYLKYFHKPQIQINNEIIIKNNTNSSSFLSNRATTNHNVVVVEETLNYTLKLNDYQEDLIEHEKIIKFQENDENFLSLFQTIKQTQFETYKNNNIIIDLCPAIPLTLEGRINFTHLYNNTNLADLITFYENINPKNETTSYNIKKNDTNVINFKTDNDNLDSLNENMIYGSTVQLGGHWKPSDCVSRSKLAVIIPYRDRFVHLAILLRNLHLILQRQMIEYRIFVTEQFGNKTIPFNKGRIMNAAFLEALKIDPDIKCFVFHDVDLISEDDRNMYTCPPYPRHMSVAIDKFRYKLFYDLLFGGVTNFRTEHYRIVNGFSNSFWGWGGELYIFFLLSLILTELKCFFLR
jgi:hypothetical protein